MNKKQSVIIVLIINILIIISLCMFLTPATEFIEPEPVDTQPTPTPTIIQQATPTPTKKLNMTASETPTQKITKDWYHGSNGGSSRRSHAPITPIPELSTFVFIGVGILTIVIKR